MKRRAFLGAAAFAGAAAAAGSAQEGTSDMTSNAKVPKRPYGKNGVELSVIGFGGIVLLGHDHPECARIVGESVERGVNYFDVAPAYGNGEAEAKLGPALEPYRKGCFLACKTGQRKRAEAETEFAESCERLRTDYFDLYQLHAIVQVERDVEAAFAADGVMAMLREKKEAGQIRHLGFSAHSVDAARAALDRYPFDSALFPLNYACQLKNGWGMQFVEAARERGAARLALKALAHQHWAEKHPRRDDYPKCWYEPIMDEARASRALRWTLGQDVTAAIPPGDLRLFRLALDIASGPLGLSEAERTHLRSEAGRLEPIFPQA